MLIQIERFNITIKYGTSQLGIFTVNKKEETFLATCTPVRTSVLGKECEFVTSVNVDLILQRAWHAIGQQNAR